MFGFGEEVRQRGEAVKLIHAAMDTARVIRGHPLEAARMTRQLRLSEQLMGRVSKWTKRRFAGKLLPNPSAVGMAMEALYFGIDDLACRPEDQKIVLETFGEVLSFAATNQEKLNDADFTLFQILGQRYLDHPLVKASVEKAS